MIFKKYAAFFQPHELDALTAAYDAVWQQVRATKPIRAERGLGAKEQPRADHSRFGLHR